MKGILLIYIASITYSIVRYVAFAPQNAANIPVLIVNKGVAMAAVLCFAYAFIAQWRTRAASPARAASATWFRAGVFGAIWHVPMSLAILEPAYFKEFFAFALDDSGALKATGRMSTAGELVFCFGGFAAGMLYLVTRQSWSAMQRWQLSLGAMALLLAHVLAMGYSRGLNINAKHAYLPPMWLLSALGIAAGLVALACCKPKAEADKPAPASNP
jgi:hypothetical protein